MKTVKSFEIQRESWESQREAGRYNPGLEIVIRVGRKLLVLPFSAGDSDDIEVFRDGPNIIMLATNDSLGYAGLEVFNSDGSLHGDIFVQNEDELCEIVGKKGLGLSPITIASRLYQCVV